MYRETVIKNNKGGFSSSKQLPSLMARHLSRIEIEDCHTMDCLLNIIVKPSERNTHVNVIFWFRFLASWLCPVCQGEEFEIGSNAGFSDISDSRSDRISVWKEVKGTEQLDRSDEMSISTERGRRLLSERSQRLSSSSFEVAAEGALEETGSGDLDESEQVCTYSDI